MFPPALGLNLQDICYWYASVCTIVINWEKSLEIIINKNSKNNKRLLNSQKFSVLFATKTKCRSSPEENIKTDDHMTVKQDQLYRS